MIAIIALVLSVLALLPSLLLVGAGFWVKRNPDVVMKAVMGMVMGKKG